MKRAVSVPNVGDPKQLVQFSREIERAGWDGFFVWDHLQIYANRRYDIIDPWMLLGAVAQVTERIRLGTMVTPLSRRRPWQVAKQLVTLDHLSNGRALMGVGLGAPVEDEFAAFGEATDLRERAARTDEALEIIDRMLRGERVDHRGEHYSVQAQLHPAAMQSPRPPIWIAATPPHRKPLERAARWDGVVCNVKLDSDSMPMRPDEVRQYVGDFFRSPNLAVCTTQHPAHRPEEYEAIGVDWLITGWLAGPRWLDQFRKYLGMGG